MRLAGCGRKKAEKTGNTSIKNNAGMVIEFSFERDYAEFGEFLQYACHARKRERTFVIESLCVRNFDASQYEAMREAKTTLFKISHDMAGLD
jgi:hypothetical protein